VAASAIVFAAFGLRSFSGFGAAMAAIALLTLFTGLDLRGAVLPLLAILSIVNTAFILIRSREHARWREGGLLLLGALPGLGVGLTFYALGSDQGLRLGLGGLIALLGGWLAIRGGWPEHKSFPRRAGPLAGMIAGMLSGAFGISGPPIVVYLSGRRLNRHEFRATLMVFFIVLDALRLSYFTGAGRMNAALWLLGLSLYPLSLLGTWAGERLHARAGENTYRRLVGATLAAVGLAIAVKAWLALAGGA